MAGRPVKETIHAKGVDIGIYTNDFENEFISLTDIAKYRNEDDPRFVIQNWMRNRNTIEFLAVWEELHNPDFNRVQFETVRSEAGLNRFVMTPTKWVELVNAIGITSKAGRYGGTYAHSDIAMSFATWISPEFQLYIMKDYRRLKKDENSRLSLDWNLNREITKLNYRIHTDAIKENLIPPGYWNISVPCRAVKCTEERKTTHYEQSYTGDSKKGRGTHDQIRRPLDL